jgi:aryl-alcohol dehydrogenase
MRVTAAVMEERSGVFKLQSLELDAPRPDEVLVEITAAGICHTDLHARDGYFAMPYPAVYGHEGAGIVAAVGSAVEHLAAGDHVVILFPWCGECEHCRQDQRSYCQRGRELKSAGTRADGSTTLYRNGVPIYGSFFQQSSFATHVLTPARNAVKVRHDAPLEFLGPLGCGLQTGAGAGRIVRGAIQGDSRPDQFIPYLVDLFVAGRFPIDRLVTFTTSLRSIRRQGVRSTARPSNRCCACRNDAEAWRNRDG